MQSDLASLFRPYGFIVWGQSVSCPGSAWLVCSLFLSLCLSPVSLSQAHQGPAPKCLASSPILNEWGLCPKPSPNGPDDAATQKFRGMHSSCGNSGFAGGARGKGVCQCRRLRDAGSIPGSGRSPGGGHGNPLQYSCLKNPMDRGAWRATVHRVAKNQA